MNDEIENKIKYFEQILLQISILNKKTYSKKVFNHHPELLNEIIEATDFLPDDVKLSERIYCIKQKILERKRCPVCKIGFLKYDSHRNHYHETGCSPKCSKNNPTVKAKVEKTCLKVYGCKSHNQCKLVKEKKAQSYLKHFGVTNPSYVKEVIEKRKNTSLKNCGYDCSFKSPEKRNIGKRTCLKLYGVENVSQSSTINKKKRQKYSYNGIEFASSDELALYIKMEANGIQFEYQPAIEFYYKFDGKTHVYYPDFYIDNTKTYVEVKGDHFFKDEKMICPFRYRKWSNEQYEKACQLYQAKHQCMIENNVKILLSSSEEIKQAKAFVYVNYGKNFFRECRLKNHRNNSQDSIIQI